MDFRSYPTAHPQAASRIVDGSAVIVLADAGEVNVLNPVGTRIWELADGTRSVRGIADCIEAEYDVGAEQAQRDVAEFVQLLMDAGALVLRDRAAR